MRLDLAVGITLSFIALLLDLARKISRPGRFLELVCKRYATAIERHA